MDYLLIQIAGHGRRALGLAIAALGAENLLCATMATQPFPAQFHAVVIPVIPWVPAHPWLAYVVGTSLLCAGLALVANVQTRVAGFIIGGILLGSALALHIPRMVVVPENWGLRGEVCEMLALSAAAFVLAARSAGQAWRWDAAVATAGRFVFGIAAVVFGVDHFLALKLIAGIIPAWMPAHLFLASLTGAAMIAAGVSIAARWMDGLAALGLGMVFLIFVVTLHAPRVLASPRSPDEWSSALIALGMCGASWLFAGRSHHKT